MWREILEDDETIEKKKKTQVRLTGLKVLKVSLVDKPANGETEFVIMKRALDEADRRAGEQLVDALCAAPDGVVNDVIADMDPNDAADLHELMLQIERAEAEELRRIDQRQDELHVLAHLREMSDEGACDFINSLDDADAQAVHDLLARQLQRAAA